MSNNPPPQPPGASPPPWSPAPQQQPSWSPSPQAVAPPAAAPPAAQPVPQAPDLTRSYAEWFDWASRHFSDEHSAHVATGAAIAALKSGADPAAAIAAGEQAATEPDTAGRPLTVDDPTKAYAAWFVWARRRAGLDVQRAHLAALAGRGAQASGEQVATAQSHALAAAGVGPAVASGARAVGGISWRDPALRAIVFGIVCLAVPLLFNWYFILLPFLGLVYSIRALTQSRLVMGIIGVVLNSLASLLTAALFFHLI